MISSQVEWATGVSGTAKSKCKGTQMWKNMVYWKAVAETNM